MLTSNTGFGLDALRNDFANISMIVFVCNDFTRSEQFDYLRRNEKLIIGPAVIKKRALDGLVILLGI